MWEQSLTIQSPFGVSVFGSALLRVSPDSASIIADITRLEQKPSDAFAKARKASQSVVEYLRHASVSEFGASRVSLSQDMRYVGGETRFMGYKARISFGVVLRSLDRVDEVISGLVDAGTNEIGSISFQTSRLREFRAEVRRLAIQAAKEKAQVYSEAAGVALGEVLHIQDVNPQVLQGRSEGHVKREPVVDNDTDKQLLDPSAIEVGAAVLVGFRLAPKSA